jgi:hypothetical protein
MNVLISFMISIILVGVYKVSIGASITTRNIISSHAAVLCSLFLSSVLEKNTPLTATMGVLSLMYLHDMYMLYDGNLCEDKLGHPPSEILLGGVLGLIGTGSVYFINS